MRLRHSAFLLLAAVLLPAVFAPSARARPPLIVKKFLVGHLEEGTYRFIATGGRGTRNAYRDSLLLLVFSGPVDFDTIDTRTIRIGSPTGDGLRLPAEGSFYRYVTYAYDHCGGYSLKRSYRNRVIFDPTADQDPDPFRRNPEGFEANSIYEVTLPGVDAGTTRVVEDTGGGPTEATFTTTFGTTDEYFTDR